MSASDPKKQLEFLKQKHVQVVENMRLLRQKVEALTEAFELAEAIEQEIWDGIKYLEEEIKDDENHMRNIGVVAGVEFTKKGNN